MGPGTYPEGKGHWNDPKGWWLPKEKGGEHTYGNPPAAPMYDAVKTIEQKLLQIRHFMIVKIIRLELTTRQIMNQKFIILNKEVM